MPPKELVSERFPTPAPRFVSTDLDAGDWSQLEPVFHELQVRPLESVEQLEAWLLDVSELESALYAEEARRYIDMTCHTDDEEKQKRYLEFVREVDPRVKVALDRLYRRYLESSLRADLPRDRYAVLDRIRKNDVELFREENVDLEAKDTELATRYTEIVGGMTIELDGEQVTLARASLELEEPDRERRESVWRKVAARRFEEEAEVERIYGELLDVRRRIAVNAGFDNFRDYQFRKLHRFDYGVAECETFHDAVEQVVVPSVSRINESRRSRLGLEALRPWDYDVDPNAAEPFRPFKTEPELCDVTRTLFRHVSPDFAEDFAELERLDLLDLFSRPGKAPGGYQYFLEDVRLPFIFANAAGAHDDVQTLLHEGGHAFHSLAVREDPITLYRDPPIEFCEVASMSMELLALEHLGRVYPEEAARRARRNHLERTVRLLPWIATVDAFQHAAYTRLEGADARRRGWVEIRHRFAPETDWQGLEKYLAVEWHRQTHLFRHPFYYIEYGIALTGALQLWSLARRDHGAAVENYRRALAAGGSRPLGELFELAGLRFEFGADLLGTLVEEVVEEIRRAEA